MAKTVKINGSLYRSIERSTLGQDFYVMKQIRAAGLMNCTQDPGESAQDFGMRILSLLVERGAPIELLAGMLVPDGIPDEKWTPDHAATTAALLSRVTDPAEKAEIQKILIEIITDFFVAGLRSSERFRIASPMAAPGAATGMKSAAPSSQTTAIGAPWYARLPGIRSIITAQ